MAVPSPVSCSLMTSPALENPRVVTPIAQPSIWLWQPFRRGQRHRMWFMAVAALWNNLRFMRHDSSSMRTREDQPTEGVGVTRLPLSFHPLFFLTQAHFSSRVLAGDAAPDHINTKLAATAISSEIATYTLACGIQARDYLFLVNSDTLGTHLVGSV
jgi:hypothetical protein